MATYNGHKNWNHWNVSLWINNDEVLYRLAIECVRRSRTKEDAAEQFMMELECMGVDKTPDGAPYSVTSIKAAMRDL